ncbi:MAG: hypothetical protein LBJ22_01450 [Synergistaceae bacterium]|nr:hypothetical protein [Synergistaceae bacterium]
MSDMSRSRADGYTILFSAETPAVIGTIVGAIPGTDGPTVVSVLCVVGTYSAGNSFKKGCQPCKNRKLTGRIRNFTVF